MCQVPITISVIVKTEKSNFHFRSVYLQYKVFIEYPRRLCNTPWSQEEVDRFTSHVKHTKTVKYKTDNIFKIDLIDVLYNP